MFKSYAAQKIRVAGEEEEETDAERAQRRARSAARRRRHHDEDEEEEGEAKPTDGGEPNGMDVVGEVKVKTETLVLPEFDQDAADDDVQAAL